MFNLYQEHDAVAGSLWLDLADVWNGGLFWLVMLLCKELESWKPSWEGHADADTCDEKNTRSLRALSL